MKKNQQFKKPVIKKQKIKLNIFARRSFRMFPEETILLATHTGSHGSCSDRRFKTKVAPIENSLEKLLRLNGKRFNWKDTKDKRGNIGFIAQEVERVVPEVVSKNPMRGFYTIEYDKITPLLVEGIKEQQRQIKALQKEITLLKQIRK